MMGRTEPGVTRGDDGFTLVELIIAVIIVGVISAPLADVVLSYLRNADETTGRLLESHDVQIASTYWAQDVASTGTRSTKSPFPLTQSVETNVPYGSGLFPCGAAGTPSAMVRLGWDEFTGSGTATLVRVAYVVQTVSGQTQLRRLRCDGSAAVISDVTIARDLDASTPPALTCTTPAACTSTAVPQTISLKLTLKDPGNRGNPYVITLTGARRQTS